MIEISENVHSRLLAGRWNLLHGLESRRQTFFFARIRQKSLANIKDRIYFSSSFLYFTYVSLFLLFLTHRYQKQTLSWLHYYIPHYKSMEDASSVDAIDLTAFYDSILFLHAVLSNNLHTFQRQKLGMRRLNCHSLNVRLEISDSVNKTADTDIHNCVKNIQFICKKVKYFWSQRSLRKLFFNWLFLINLNER